MVKLVKVSLEKCPDVFVFRIWVLNPKIGVAVIPQIIHLFIGFGTIINHPFWDTPIFGNTHLYETKQSVQKSMNADKSKG